VTSSHSGSPSKGVWPATRTHIPCRGFPVKLHRRMRSLRRGAGVLLLGCVVLVGCQRPLAQPVGEVPAPTRVAPKQGAVGRPVSIAIPAAGVKARVVPVGLRPDRTVEVPGVDLAGWYEVGPRPGEAGPAVIVGHVDSRSGPAVFFRLGELQRGDRIVVGQAGGVARSFVVHRVERSAKEALPVGRIWNRTRQPVLRLITCGGSFDRSTGHYRDNVIVYAQANN
jgi:sortase (surface protein transpeptidase)